MYNGVTCSSSGVSILHDFSCKNLTIARCPCSAAIHKSVAPRNNGVSMSNSFELINFLISGNRPSTTAARISSAITPNYFAQFQMPDNKQNSPQAKKLNTECNGISGHIEDDLSSMNYYTANIEKRSPSLPVLHQPPSESLSPPSSSSSTGSPFFHLRGVLRRQKSSEAIPIPQRTNVCFKDTPSYREVSSIWSRQLELGLRPHTPEPVPNPFLRSKLKSEEDEEALADEAEFAEADPVAEWDPPSTPLDALPQFQPKYQEHTCCILQ
eukprot:TRINITY_DN21409_c0_g1_i2.p1 TRINITY_DN21409_c0_g1~~TRINITY_DN21409_c0_g1_i2.p1  ORF type:complete len:268 (+),score=27.00 TRINITY_DN21409_c0_g1_i2:876-1679(+)